MADVKCPYCGKEQYIDHDDGYGYEEDTWHQQRCISCEEIFDYKTWVAYYYDIRETPLNQHP